MYPDQYFELISRYFKIEAGCTAYEKFTSDSYVSTLLMLHIDASPLPEPTRPNAIKNPVRALSRLKELGVGVGS